MLSLSRFSAFQEDGHVATCEIDGKVKYSIPSETDSLISRLVPFVSFCMKSFITSVIFHNIMFYENDDLSNV